MGGRPCLHGLRRLWNATHRSKVLEMGAPQLGPPGSACTESHPGSVGPRAGLLLAPSAVGVFPPHVLFKGHREQTGTSLFRGKRKTIQV